MPPPFVEAVERAFLPEVRRAPPPQLQEVRQPRLSAPRCSKCGAQVRDVPSFGWHVLEAWHPECSPWIGEDLRRELVRQDLIRPRRARSRMEEEERGLICGGRCAIGSRECG